MGKLRAIPAQLYTVADAEGTDEWRHHWNVPGIRSNHATADFL